MQKDPLIYVDGMNDYSYVGNNSVNYIDPTGNNIFFGMSPAMLSMPPAALGVNNPFWSGMSNFFRANFRLFPRSSGVKPQSGIKPGTGNPGTGNPGTGNPGTGNPGTGNPGTGNPGTGNPGTGNPGTGNPGTGPGDPGNGGNIGLRFKSGSGESQAGTEYGRPTGWNGFDKIGGFAPPMYYPGYPDNLQPEDCSEPMPKHPQFDKCNWQDQLKDWIEQLKNWNKSRKDCMERNKERARQRSNFV